MKKTLVLLLAASAIVAPAAASAAVVDLSFSGTIAGLSNSTPFSNIPLTVTATSDLGDLLNGSPVALDNVFATVPGFVTDYALPNGFSLTYAGGLLGVNFGGTTYGQFAFDLGSFNTNGSTMASINGSLVGDSTPFALPGIPGTIKLTDVSGTFSASLAGAVPEPASWAMMIAGFGLVGGSMRRRSAYRMVQAV